jgi:N,N-dimethylformamidase
VLPFCATKVENHTITDELNLQKELIGYADEISVPRGATIAFKVSTDAPHYDAAIVRLIHGDANGPGFKEEVIEAEKRHSGRKQLAHSGSYGIVPAHPALSPAGSFTIQMWIYSTTPRNGVVQGLLSKWSNNGGYALVIGEAGDVRLRLGDGQTVRSWGTGKPLRARQWYFIAASFDPGRQLVELHQEPLSDWPFEQTAAVTKEASGGIVPLRNDAPILFAADHLEGRKVAGGLYNGKIERPALYGRSLRPDEIEGLKSGVAPAEFADLIAAWDFSIGMPGRKLTDVGPNGAHGLAVNMPMRAVTGRNWQSAEQNFKHAPSQYGAIHFHDDDLEDAAWETSFEWHVPQEVKSGVYAARLRHGDQEDHIPFFVRPKRGTATAKTAILFPTMTYLAYANETHKSMGKHQAVFPDRVLVKDPLDHYLADHPEFGVSLYDTHSDGSGNCYSSRLRPIPSLRPKYRQWLAGSPRHLAGDLYLVDWLEALGFDYDAITDHDLHFEGEALLADYRVVITGTHPEYWSGPMRAAMVAYLGAGGRLMYLGGNGYYWVTGIDAERPHVIEVRKGIAGTRAWNSEPGELHMSTTGELGGLWRHRGKPPNEIAGNGFKAMGWHAPTPGFKRQSGSFDRRAAFIFEGIGPDETIGNFGLSIGGAAGDELDRIDFALGSPPHTLLLASASGYNEHFIPVIEDHLELQEMVIREQFALVRADMVFYETKNGGAVFSCGAISWCGSLSHNRYENNVSRITENVLRNFLSRT